jgi:hypothetical protein
MLSDEFFLLLESRFVQPTSNGVSQRLINPDDGTSAVVRKVFSVNNEENYDEIRSYIEQGAIVLNNRGNKRWSRVIEVETTKNTRIKYIYYSNRESIVDDEILLRSLPVDSTGTLNWHTVDVTTRTLQAQDSLSPSKLSNLSDLSFSAPENEFTSKAGLNDRGEFTKDEQDRINDDNERLKQAIKGDDLITVDNIAELVRTQTGRGFTEKKTNYLANLLKVFTEKTNSPNSIFPLKLTGGSTVIGTSSAIGISDSNSITVNFMEVIHPIALLTGNCRGNGKDMLLSYLEADSWDDLKKNAKISYPTGNYPLIDSEIFYPSEKGRGFTRVMVSSKKAGGMTVSFAGINGAWKECQQLANEKWNKEVKPLIDGDFEYFAAWTILELFLSSASGEEALAKWREAAEYLELEENDDVITAVSEKLNEGNAFSELVIWIYNHSAMIQVDTYEDEHGGHGKDKATVLTNIVATWPSQLAEKVRIEKPTGGNVYSRVKLNVNGREVANTVAPKLSDRDGTTQSDERSRVTKMSDYPGPRTEPEGLLGQYKYAGGVRVNSDEVKNRVNAKIAEYRNQAFQELTPLLAVIKKNDRDWPNQLAGIKVVSAGNANELYAGAKRVASSNWNNPIGVNARNAAIKLMNGLESTYAELEVKQQEWKKEIEDELRKQAHDKVFESKSSILRGILR